MEAHTNEISPPGDDVEELPTEPAERKRVLNVLAQRRYRRRKKQRQAMLENLVGQNATPRAASGPGSTNSPDANMTISQVVPGSNDGPEALPSCNEPVSSDQMDFSGLIQPWDDSMDSWLMLSLGSSSGSSVHQHSNSSASPASGTSPSEPPSLSEFLQEDDTEHCTFSDDFQLVVSELGLLRAGVENASRLHSAERLWDLTANSVFLDIDSLGESSSWMVALPVNLQPTHKQLTTAHHPIIDILPWPAVRNKLIDVYALPVDFWPKHPSDGESCSLIRLVYDMEDGGVRVWGADPAAEDAWEVNDDFAKAWWWMLDPRVLRHSNRRRMERGEQPLRQIEAPKS